MVAMVLCVTKSRTSPPQQALTRVRAHEISMRNFFPLAQCYTHLYYLLLTPYFTFKPYLQWSTHFMHMKGVGTSEHLLTSTSKIHLNEF
jgi:hypothetical protein